MLSLMLMLLQDPSTPPPAPVLEPDIRLRVPAGLSAARCDAGGYQRIERPAGEVRDLRPDMTYRPDGEVRHYLLLDRWVRGCPEPISYPLPERQDGFIRELGRTPPPVRLQPPRSSE
ncbi:hypothetical protein [Brevundimonas sp.]|uniref:hypothetical protein n=1 Tax=Brevundimonas sp. TaxID=1871086 RepID=UPI002FC6A988